MRRFLQSSLILLVLPALSCSGDTKEGDDEDGDGYTLDEGDCDDTDASSYPEALEICDGLDNDCDGQVPLTERDNDVDGYVECVLHSNGWKGPDSVIGWEDCDDDVDTVHPDAEEICDGLDNDCDEELPDAESDLDGDTYVACEGTETWVGSDAILGWSDCDDSQASVYPGAEESCDGADTDCDGTLPADESDEDEDGYVACAGESETWIGDEISGWEDCDDADATISPGSNEICDGLDNDCDGDLPIQETDTDGDGYMDCELDDNAPSISSVTIDPDPPKAADTLTCSYEGFFDPNGDPDQSTLEWQVNGSYVGQNTTLTGVFIYGDIVTCAVTPFDGTWPGNTLVAAVTVANTAPVISSVTLSPDPATKNDTLSCSPDSVTDADNTSAINLGYTWDVSGSDPGASSNTLSSVHFERGDVVSCSVTPDDGTSTGSTVTSNSVTISNSAPSINSANITPDPADASDTLSCNYSGFNDPDGDSDQSTILWTINGSTAGTGSTLAGGFVGDDLVSCEVTPSDGSTTGTPVSAGLVISSAGPILASVDLSPTSAAEGDTLTCTPGVTTDVDGETSFTYATAWDVDGSDPGVSDTTLSSDYFNRGEAVLCTVTPSDSQSAGDPVDSNTVVISNTAPSLGSVSVSPSSPNASDSLSCSWSGFTDIDGDSDASIVSWTNDTSGTSLGSATTVSGGYAGNDTVTCTVTPSDGTDSGTALSDSVVVSNSAPSISSVSISPSSAKAGETLTCSWSGFSDPDGDSDASTVAWTNEFTGVSIGTGTTVSSGFLGGHEVSCTVTPSDGVASGTALTDSLTISNTAPSITSLSLSPSTVYTNDTITGTVGTTDIDGDTVTVTYVWYRDGSALSSTGATLDGSNWFDKGHSITLEVTPNDGSEDGSSSTSSALSISNSAPSEPSVSFETEEPVGGEDDVVCLIDTESTDDDSDGINYAFSWSVDGSSWTGSTSTSYRSDDTINSGDTEGGESWTCTVTPFDSQDSGTPGTVTVTLRQTCNPDGTYTQSVKSGGRDTQGATLFDVDQDGYEDLVFVNKLDEDMWIYWGDGTGSFTLFDTESIGGSDGYVAFGDLDETDASIDAIASNTDLDRLVLLIGSGGGSFSSTVEITENNTPGWVALADVDHDGHLDLLVVLEDLSCTGLRIGDGLGNFDAPSCLNYETGAIKPIDIDSDGTTELVQHTVDGSGNNGLTLYETDSSGAISSSTTIDTSYFTDIGAPQIYDIDSDGDDDILAFVDLDSTGLEALAIFWNNGTGVFTPCEEAVGNIIEKGAVVGDFNDDGRPDHVSFSACTTCNSSYYLYLHD